MLNELLRMYSSKDLIELLKSKGYLRFNWDSEVTVGELKDRWRSVGDNPSNASTIQILNESEKGIIERLSNAIDSVLELNKIKYNLKPKTSEDVVKYAYPNFYKMRNRVLQGKLDRANSADASDVVILAVNDGYNSKKPVFDVIDFGIGILGKDFSDTILSIQGKNKIMTKENYMIGSFGQGGSTSLKFAYVTLILSKKDKRYFFTVVHKFRINGYKKPVYAYLVQENSAIELESDLENFNPEEYSDYIRKFIDSDSGTIVRMYDYEIQKELRSNEITKPIGMLSYINTELYNVSLPVKLVDDRKDMLINVHSQPRYSYGTLMKMMTSANNIKEYNGEFEIEHHNKTFKVYYYVILPNNKDDWSKDSACEEKFREFSHHGKSIFYSVNGQYITHEHYTKIRNRGLMFLEHRLLVEINLDQLEDKYDYFTSDRNQVILNEMSRGLLEEVIEKLVSIDRLVELNETIAEMMTKSKIDYEIIKEISEEIKNDYIDLLNQGDEIYNNKRKPRSPKPRLDIEYADEIVYLNIDNKKSVFEKSERKSIFLSTGAKKFVNNLQKENIFAFLVYDSQTKSLNLSPKIMNNTIIYDLDIFEYGIYSLYFESFKLGLKSNKFDFEVVEDQKVEDKNQIKNNLDLDIQTIENIDAEYICQISHSNFDGKEQIKIVINFGHQDIMSLVSGMRSEAIEKFKQDNIKPIALFVLLMKEDYSNIDNFKIRNRMIMSLLKSINRK